MTAPSTPSTPDLTRQPLTEAGSFPHRGAWRHASWCSWERVEGDCTCGLDDARRSLLAIETEAASPVPAPTEPWIGPNGEGRPSMADDARHGRRAKRIDWSNVVVDEGDEAP